MDTTELLKAFRFYLSHGLKTGDALCYASEESVTERSRSLSSVEAEALVRRVLAEGGQQVDTIAFIDSGAVRGATVGAGYVKSGRKHSFVFNPRHLTESTVLHECAHALSGGVDTHSYKFYPVFTRLLAQYASNGQSLADEFAANRAALVQSRTASLDTTYVGRNGTVYSLRDEGDRNIDAYVGDQIVGSMTAYDNGEMRTIQVNTEHRRNGLATAMYEYARQQYPEIHHSTPEKQTADGAAWARTAMPSWRDRGARPDVDALIAPDTGRSRRNLFEVVLYGETVAREATLAQAKAFVEAIYGDVEWRRVPGDRQAHWDPTWGSTTEFNDARVYHVVERLPRLAPNVAQRLASADEITLYHGTNTSKVDAIRRDGLHAPSGVNELTWYMLTTSREQAEGYAQGYVANGTGGVVIEYRVPATLTRRSPDGGRILFGGIGHSVYGQDATVYAIKGSLPGSYITAVYPVTGAPRAASRTAAGQPPANLRLEVKPSRRGVLAWLPDREIAEIAPWAKGRETVVGELNWTEDGKVSWVAVPYEELRRRGIATALWNLAKTVEPRLHHSEERSQSGDAWARATDWERRTAAIDPQRQGLCFPLAFQHAMANEDPDIRLVHGTINGGRTPHAWVEWPNPDGEVYDPVLDESFDLDDYYRDARAKAEQRYTVDEAERKFASEQHYGPWDGSVPRGGYTASVTASAAQIIDGGPIQGGHILYAEVGGQRVGYLWWYTQDDRVAGATAGEVGNVEVDEEYRRQGIATALWERAKAMEPRLHHSPAQTEEGAAWAGRVAMHHVGFGVFQQRVYEMQRAVRPVAKVFPTLDDATVLARRVLMDEGFPNADITEAIRHPKQFGTSSVAWDMELATAGIIQPLIALSVDMQDELTVLHECAHVIANGVSRRGYKGDPSDSDAGHNPQWFAVFSRLVDRYGSPEMKRRFRLIFDGEPMMTRSAMRLEDGPLRAAPIEYSYGFTSVQALLNGRAIGYLSWHNLDGVDALGIPYSAGEVNLVQVEPEFRRRGLATALWEKALERRPDLHHSRVRSDAGDGFARSITPGVTPREWTIDPNRSRPPTRVSSATASVSYPRAHGEDPAGAARGGDDGGRGGRDPHGLGRGAPGAGQRGDDAGRRSAAVGDRVSVFVTPAAIKDYKGLTPADRTEVNRAVRALKRREGQIKPLNGTAKGLHRVSVGSSLRIVYRDHGDWLEVVLVGTHENIYKRLDRRMGAKTALNYGGDYIARGLKFYVEGRSLFERFASGNITAQEIVNALHTQTGRVGEWWGIMGTHGNLEDYRDDWAYAEETIKKQVEENVARKADDPGDPGFYIGEVGIVLIGRRPKMADGSLWDPDKHGQTDFGLMGNSTVADAGIEMVDLVEVQYDAGWGWKVLPVNMRVKAVDAETAQTGVMVALVPPMDLSDQLLSHAGAVVEPVEGLSEQHITLIYLGSTDDVDRDLLVKTVTEWARETQMLTGRVEKYGTFDNAEKGEYVLWAGWDLDGGQGWRAGLVEALSSVGIESASEYTEWVPHQTMAYADEPVEDLPTLPEFLPRVTFDQVHVVYGSDWLPIRLDLG